MNWLKAYSRGLIAIFSRSGGASRSATEGRKAGRGSKGCRTIFADFSDMITFIFPFKDFQLQKRRNKTKPISLLAKELEIKIVATNPVYYLNESDALAQEVLLAIGNGDKLADETRTVLASNQYYMKKSS